MKLLISVFIAGIGLGFFTNSVYASCQKHTHHHKVKVVHKHTLYGPPCCVVQGRPLYQRWPYSWGPTNECISERKREVHKPNCGL